MPSPPSPLLTQSLELVLPDITALLPEVAEACEVQRGYSSKVTQRSDGNSGGGDADDADPIYAPSPHSATRAPNSAPRKTPQLHHLTVTRVPGA